MKNEALFTSNTAEWGTPQWIVDRLEAEFGKFDLDPAASKTNHKAPTYFSLLDDGVDGLEQPWFGKVFLNPPYGRHPMGINWAKKVRKELQSKRKKSPQLIVCLIPVRSETQWWKTYLEVASEVRFFEGRLAFEAVGGQNDTESATFPSALLICRPRMKWVTYGTPMYSYTSAKQ